MLFLPRLGVRPCWLRSQATLVMESGPVGYGVRARWLERALVRESGCVGYRVRLCWLRSQATLVTESGHVGYGVRPR